MNAFKGKLVYSDQRECWYFLGDHEGICYPVSCGDCLWIKVFNRYRAGRIELDDDWYVIFDDASFVLLHPFPYDVKMI